ncbi:MAG: uncharacterized protein A8A55_1263 [Amphiamblys sp. WSBS2006]|nr:MAG: uncharacterized protein A8A55_1263 [Amphiamblys sp. WSBS2006]
MKNFFALVALLHGVFPEQVSEASEGGLHGAIELSPQAAHVQNLVASEDGLFVYISPEQKDTVNEKVRDIILDTRIGYMRTGIYFDTWTHDNSVSGGEKKTQMARIKKNFSRKIHSSLLPVYVVYTESPPEEEAVEERTTFIFSTLWENVFRCYYAVYSAVYTLQSFSVPPNDVLFLDYENEKVAAHNEAKRSAPEMARLQETAVSLFGEYRKLFPISENTVYKNIYFGLQDDAKFLEIEEMKPGDSDTASAKRRTEALSTLYEKVDTLYPYRALEEEKRFRVTIIKRKTRKILNHEEVVRIINQFGESIKKKKGARLDVTEVFLEDMELGEQLALIKNTDVFIALHGASLGHTMFMRKEAFIIELFPYCFRKTIYKNIARHTGVKYIRWQNFHLNLTCGTIPLEKLKKCEINWSSGDSRDFYRAQDTGVNVSEFVGLLRAILDYEDLVEENFLLYTPWEQFNNQRLAFKAACIVANKLDRILVLPYAGYRSEEETKRIQQEADDYENSVKEKDDTLFNPKKYHWAPLEKYFKPASFGSLPCRTITMAAFEMIDSGSNIRAVLDNTKKTVGRYNPSQSLAYYADVHSIVPRRIERVYNIGAEVPDDMVIPVYGQYRAKTLALGMLFNKLNFGQEKTYPLARFYDYMEDDIYEKITSNMLPTAYQEKAARQITLKSGKSTFGLSVHIRRADYAIKCKNHKEIAPESYNSCYQDAEYITDYINGLLGTKTGVNIHIATDAVDTDELKNIEVFKKHKVFFMKDIIGEYEGYLDHIEKSIVEQIICTQSDIFVGNFLSSFTRDIVENRATTSCFW